MTRSILAWPSGSDMALLEIENLQTHFRTPDGVIRARCEFCGKNHEIGPESLA